MVVGCGELLGLKTEPAPQPAVANADGSVATDGAAPEGESDAGGDASGDASGGTAAPPSFQCFNVAPDNAAGVSLQIDPAAPKATVLTTVTAVGSEALDEGQLWLCMGADGSTAQFAGSPLTAPPSMPWSWVAVPLTPGWWRIAFVATSKARLYAKKDVLVTP
jgi:hypothetical protein